MIANPHSDLQFLEPIALERQIVDLLLTGEIEPLPALRAQWRETHLVRRDNLWSLASIFAVPLHIPPVWPPTFVLDDVNYDLAGFADAGSAALEIEGGYISRLDVHLPGPWPRTGWQVERVYYLNLHRPDTTNRVARDWDRLHRILALAATRARALGGTPPTES